jgi:hypothetical protein
VIKLDKKDKELEDFQGKRVLFTLGIIVSAIVVIVVVASALSSAPAQEPEEQAVLYIDEVFFLFSGSNSASEKVTIDVTTFITNRGTADAKDVQIIAFAIDEDSNLAMDKTTFTVGDIPKDNTKPTEFSITMPNNVSYNIRLIILESGRLVIKGTGTVHLDRDYGGHGTRFSTDNDGNGESGIGFTEEGESLLVGSSYITLIFLICIVLVIMVVLKKSSNSIKSNSADYLSNESDTGEEVQDDLPRFPITNIEEIYPEESEDESLPEAEESQSTEIEEE